MPNILNCPFCRDYAKGPKQDDGVFYVECSSATCKATGPRFPDAQSAIEEWNILSKKSKLCNDILDDANEILQML